MTQVEKKAQSKMDEILIDDPQLVELILDWNGRNERRKELQTEINELDIDEVKDRVAMKLLDFGGDVAEPVIFRLEGSDITVKMTPPGESKGVSFETKPKRRFALRVPKED